MLAYRAGAQPKKKTRKKVVIKGYRVKPKVPENLFEDKWQLLAESVAAIQQSRPVSASLETLYRAVADLCSEDMGGKLYTSLEAACSAYIRTQLEALLNLTPDSVAYLDHVERCWKNHCQKMVVIRSIFLVLDRSWVIPKSKPAIWEMGVAHFRAYFCKYSEVHQKTVDGLLRLLQAERCGEAINRSLLQGLLKMLITLGIYKQTFEKQFLGSTDGYFLAEAKGRLQADELPEYLLYAERRLAEEHERATNFLDVSTRKPLISIVERRLLQDAGPGADIAVAMLEKGFDQLMEHQRVPELARLYTLLCRVDAAPKIRAAFSSYIKRKGMEIVSHPECDSTMVPDLLKFKSKLDEVLEQAFESNETFAHTLKESCEAFINDRENKPAELIAKYIDGMLRSGNKGTTEEEVEAQLCRLLVLFRYINGKDIFEAFYKHDLAKRLLLGKSGSTDSEKSMIAKLKNECGNQFTNKLEGMFKDVELSRELVQSFERSKYKAGVDIDLNVNVLTQVYWPTYPVIEVKLLPQIASSQQAFKDFYLAKYSGGTSTSHTRKLYFLNSLGTCVLKASLPTGKKELSVSLFQAVVLMQFNLKEELTFTQIAEATGIEDAEARRTLQSLACGKFRVIRKTPEGRDVNDGDRFCVSKKFASKAYRIKINQIQMKETVEENKKTTQDVYQDRQHQIDACIVRIMKTRKKLSHQLLIGDIYQQLSFPLRPQLLKKRIESLIDREYLRRNPTSPEEYLYLA